MYMGSTKQIPWFIFEKEKDMELGWEQSREVVVDPPEGREMEMNIYEYNQNSLHEILRFFTNYIQTYEKISYNSHTRVEIRNLRKSYYESCYCYVTKTSSDVRGQAIIPNRTQ